MSLNNNNPFDPLQPFNQPRPADPRLVKNLQNQIRSLEWEVNQLSRRDQGRVNHELIRSVDALKAKLATAKSDIRTLVHSKTVWNEVSGLYGETLDTLSSACIQANSGYIEFSGLLANKADGRGPARWVKPDGTAVEIKKGRVNELKQLFEGLGVQNAGMMNSGEKKVDTDKNTDVMMIESDGENDENRPFFGGAEPARRSVFSKKTTTNSTNPFPELTNNSTNKIFFDKITKNPFNTTSKTTTNIFLQKNHGKKSFFNSTPAPVNTPVAAFSVPAPVATPVPEFRFKSRKPAPAGMSTQTHAPSMVDGGNQTHAPMMVDSCNQTKISFEREDFVFVKRAVVDRKKAAAKKMRKNE